jgi:hypothetical protein
MLYLILDLTENIHAQAPVLILPALQDFVLPSFTPTPPNLRKPPEHQIKPSKPSRHHGKPEWPGMD